MPSQKFIGHKHTSLPLKWGWNVLCEKDDESTFLSYCHKIIRPWMVSLALNFLWPRNFKLYLVLCRTMVNHFILGCVGLLRTQVIALFPTSDTASWTVFLPKEVEFLLLCINVCRNGHNCPVMECARLPVCLYEVYSLVAERWQHYSRVTSSLFSLVVLQLT